MSVFEASVFEPLRPEELRRAAAVLLADPGSGLPAAAEAVAAFCDYIQDGALAWEGLRCGAPAAPTALFLALRLPGRTAIVVTPAPDAPGISAAAQASITAAGLAALRDCGLHYAQALVEPEAAGKRELLRQAGFRPLAALLYLQRDSRYPWVEPPAAGEVAWLAYGPATRVAFAETVLATYEDSLDCPELTGFRPIEDILAAHQASGRFVPGLWELAQRDGEAAGCLLLSELGHGSMMEIVYMGVRRAWRGRGVGRLLLRRALERAREAGARLTTVVVDARNAPARGLYERFAFAAVARREAYLYRWTCV